MLGATTAPSVVHEYASHGLRGGAEEVPAPVPSRRRLGSDAPEVRLVHQRRGLKRVIRSLGCHPLYGQPAQLVVHERQEFGGRAGVAFANGIENPSYVSHRLRLRSIVHVRLRTPLSRPISE